MAGNFEADAEAMLPRGVKGRQGAPAGAEWPTAQDVIAAYRYERKARPKELLLGWRGVTVPGTGTPIGFGDDRHILLCAGSRAGKTVSYLAPWLLLYDGSALVLDPKGELAALTAKQRLAKGQRVFIVDPFNVSRARDKPHLADCVSGYNPLLDLDIGSSMVLDDVATLAEALIDVPSDGDRHWAESAITLLRGLILLVLSVCPATQCHFGTVRNMLNGTDRDIEDWAERQGRDIKPGKAIWHYMASFQDSGDEVTAAVNRVISGVGKWILNMGDDERGSVLSSARTQTRFLDSPDLIAAMKTGGFGLKDIKVGSGPRGANVTVYLCLPASLMVSHGRWMRLMLSLALIAFERARLPAEVPESDMRRLPVLFVLEELATTIGYLRQVESAAGLMAGFGIKLVSVIQDLGQLQHHYRHSWQTFIGNAGVSIFFGNCDATTLEYVASRLGQTSFLVSEPSGASPGALLSGARATNERLQTVPLLLAPEIEQFVGRDTGLALVLPAGKPAFYVTRTNYRTEEGLAGLYDRTA